MAQQDLTLGTAFKGIGMGLFAGALFVFAAMAVERTIIKDLRK